MHYSGMKYRDGRKLLDEPENIFLLIIVCFIFGLLIYGETIVKIPRYYSVEITNSHGKKEWVFMTENSMADDEAVGEENELWEPPCLAEDDDVVDDEVSAVVVEELSDAMYDSLNETALTQEEYDQILQVEESDQT